MDNPIDILRALAERNRLQNVALRGELHHVGASQLRQLDRALDALSPGELGAMAQAAENQVDWFDAFQDVQNFLMDRDLIQEADIHPKKPEQTLITALTRALKDHEPLSPATTRRLTELAATWDAESNRLQDRYALGLSTAASQLRHVLLKVEPSTPGAAPVKHPRRKGTLPSDRPCTLLDALRPLGHEVTSDTWQLTVTGGVDGDTVKECRATFHMHDDLTSVLHALYTDPSLAPLSLPEQWELKSHGGGLKVKGSPRFIALHPIETPKKQPAPAQAAAPENAWHCGKADPNGSGTLQAALDSIGYANPAAKWTLRAWQLGHSHSGQSFELRVKPGDDLLQQLRLLLSDARLGNPKLPSLWTLERHAKHILVRGLFRYGVSLRPDANAPAAATDVSLPVFRDASRRVDVLQDETLYNALRRLTRSSDWTQAGGPDGRWVVHSVAGERSGGHFHISTAALLHKELHGSVKTYFGRECRDLTLTLYGLDERHVLLDVKTGDGDPLEVVLELR